MEMDKKKVDKLREACSCFLLLSVFVMILSRSTPVVSFCCSAASISRDNMVRSDAQQAFFDWSSLAYYDRVWRAYFSVEAATFCSMFYGCFSLSDHPLCCY